MHDMHFPSLVRPIGLRSLYTYRPLYLAATSHSSQHLPLSCAHPLRVLSMAGLPCRNMGNQRRTQYRPKPEWKPKNIECLTPESDGFLSNQGTKSIWISAAYNSGWGFFHNILRSIYLWNRFWLNTAFPWGANNSPQQILVTKSIIMRKTSHMWGNVLRITILCASFSEAWMLRFKSVGKLIFFVALVGLVTLFIQIEKG